MAQDAYSCTHMAAVGVKGLMHCACTVSRDPCGRWKSHTDTL